MNSLIDKKQIDLLNINKDKTKDKKWHIGSDYPVYPLDSDEPENFYANIYNYLLKRNNNQNGENYPNYIYECEDNIETKKRVFRRKASNFEIDEDDILCYKVPDSYNGNDSSEESDDFSNENKKNKSKLTKKDLIKAGRYSLFKIPYKCNEYDLIKEIHEKINHRNFDDTRKNLKNKGIIMDIL